MRRAERLFRLINEMRAQDTCRAVDLAARLEVSLSTIYRDIAHLQASGLPIEGEAGIGYILRPGFDMPSVTFTHDQVEALAVGLAFVESAGDPSLAAAAREARAKLQAGLPAPEERRLSEAPFFSLSGKYSAPDEVGRIRTAMRNRQIVVMSYRNAAGEASIRRVQPVAIWNLTDGWMFSGWCQLRGDFRTFRFDRIASLEVSEERFDADVTKGLQAFLAKDSCEKDTIAPSRAV